MYEDYMQNLLGDNYSPYQDTYDSFSRNTNYYDELSDCEQCNYDASFENYSPYMHLPDINYNTMPYNNMPNYSSRNLVTDLENLYPEIYKIIYPMVQKACTMNTKPIDEKAIEDMTNDIYSNIEAENIVNININVDNNTSENNRNLETSKITLNNKNAEIQTKTNRNISVNGNHIENRENRETKGSRGNIENSENRESRQFNNSLKDLIRILLIRELLPGGNRPPRPRPPRPRPPFPPRPRPPMPPRPPFPPRPDFSGNPPPRPPRPRF